MSLVLAFTGSEGAVIAGDLREILMQGSDEAISGFEDELYSGQIMTDSDLMSRAVEMGIILRLRDDKCKVSDCGGILMGEVTESEGGRVRKRRLYVACGSYAVVDIEDDIPVLKQKGSGSSFIVLGNEVTKRIAYGMIRSEWKNGTFSDAVRLVIHIMNTAPSRTASVSRAFAILQTRKRTDLDIGKLLSAEK